MRGPGPRTLDFGLAKNFPISEAKHFQFSAQFINLTNTPICQTPNTNVNSTQFGQIRGSRGERYIQLALEFDF
ncbi:MAG: hypothetical protein ACRD22_06100 [Terriglobia bacterium]